MVMKSVYNYLQVLTQLFLNDKYYISQTLISLFVESEINFLQ